MAIWRFRMAKMLPFKYPRWPPRGGHLEMLQTISHKLCRIDWKLDGRHPSDIEIQNY